LVHFITLASVGTNIDYGAVLCGYFGIMLLGAFYSSIGLFASSVTENQVVAFIIAISVVIVFYLLDKILIFTPAALTGILQYISVEYHLSNISRGVVDSRNIIYFLSMIWMFLSLTIRVVEIRKWR
jgi:ABC-2 type transport system permease protein